MTFIFDFDQTLANSSVLEPLRKARQWQRVKSQLNQIVLYPEMNNILMKLKDAGHQIGVVTTSPKTYCQDALRHLRISVDCIVGYHCTSLKKPNPDPIIYALTMLNAKPVDSIGFGDTASDITAYNRAGIKSVGCTWGCSNVEELKSARPQYLISSTTEILSFI